MDEAKAMKESGLKERNIYLKKLIAFQDTELVKVITGIRRCGKSSLLRLMAIHLRDNGVSQDQIIEMNFESFAFRKMNADGFYEYVKSRIVPGKRMYFFFDELQRIPSWEEAVNSFRVDFDCDIYITGSNAYLLSGEYATYLSGRYVEIKMLPLSFKEFLDFNDLTVKTIDGSLGLLKTIVTDRKGVSYELKDAFDSYMRYGGMPGIEEVGLDQEKAMSLLDGIYSTVVMRDILERESKMGQKRITNPFLLRNITLFLADNIGSNVSLTNVGNVLADEGLLEGNKGRPSAHTVQDYVGALLESYFFYGIKRFDIKGKGYLKSLGKYYIVDIGLRNYLLGYRNRDYGHILENIVYLELLRRGYDVAVGKIDDSEIDFIASDSKGKRYIQVSESINDPKVKTRALSPLLRLGDNYEKTILCMDVRQEEDYEGIKIKNLVDWLVC